MIKVLQMYYVRIVSAISQRQWRDQNALLDPKIDFRDRRPAHLRGVYNRLRAAAVQAGVGGVPKLDPSYWRSQLSGPKQAPAGSGLINSIPLKAPVNGAGARNSELTEHVLMHAIRKSIS